MSSNIPRVALVLGAALALPSGAQIRAEFQNEVYPTAGYTGTTDVTITIQDDPDGKSDQNYHSRTELAADGFPARQSSLMHFPLTGGQIPAGATISGAELEFYVTNESWTGFSVYEVLRPWNETEATYLNATSNQTWAVPGAAGVGADRGAIPFSTFGHLDAGSVLVPVTDAGVDLVRRWINGGAPNNGLIVQDYDSWDKMAWYSSDDTARPPFLVVHYNSTMTARIRAADDTMIAYQPATSSSWDGWGLGFSGRDGGSTSSLVRWDLSAIPPGVKVTNAGMVFTVNRLPAGDAGPVEIYPALVPWTEKANWSTYDGTNPWLVQGAQGASVDRGPRAGSFPPTCTAAQSLCAVAPTELVAVVQKWVDNPSSNHGLSLQNYANNDDLQLIDSEWPVPGRRPKLSVQFTWDAGSPLKVYPASAAVYPSEGVSMKAFGGVAPYTYFVSGISGGTNIDQSGNYTAGLFAGQDQVRVVDQGGAEAFATIVVLINSSTVDGGSPVVISFPTPSQPVPPQGNFAVIADISSRAATPAAGLMLDISGEALNPVDATLVGSGRLSGTLDAGFLLPVLDTGSTLQVSITGSMNAVPSDRPAVTAAVRSGPVVLARATTDVPLGVPPPISTGCSCGPTSGGMGVVLLAGILQMAARRRASRRG